MCLMIATQLLYSAENAIVFVLHNMHFILTLPALCRMQNVNTLEDPIDSNDEKYNSHLYQHSI